MPDLGGLAIAALTVLAAIVGLRLLFLTVLGFVRPAMFIEEVRGTGGKDDIVPGLADLIESELAALREEGGGPGLRLVTTPDAAIDVGTIEAGGSHLKELNALLHLLPGRTRTVSSQLQPAGALGQGMTLTLGTSAKRVLATTTLWEGLFLSPGELPADLVTTSKDGSLIHEGRHCLGLAAAAWIAYQALRSSTAADRTGLLTQDWESYAFFRIGARMQLLGLMTVARRLYIDALARDPRNRGALFNLAVLDFQESNERSSIERLATVLAEIERTRSDRDSASEYDRLWYRAMYNMAAAWLNQAARTLQSVEESARKAQLLVSTLVSTADVTIEDIGGEDALTTGSRYGDLVRFLVEVRAASIVIYSDAWALAPTQGTTT